MSEHSRPKAPRPLLAYASVTIAFVALGFAVAFVMRHYWLFVMQPRLRLEGQEQATLVAQSQAGALAAALSPAAGRVETRAVIDALDHILVFSDPVSKAPFFRSIALELDYEAVKAPPGTLDLRRGATSCENCFLVSAPLYSSRTDEVIGQVEFQVGAEFFLQMIADVKRTLTTVAGITLGMLAVVWLVVLFLVGRMQREIGERERAEGALREATKAAEQANRAKSDFLANMSHEIRTPMNAIVGVTYLARQTGPPPRLADYLAKIDAASRSLLRIINDILDFSKIEAGRLPIEKVPFNLEATLEGVINLASVHARGKNIELALSLDGHLPETVLGDPLRLEQVILNLTTNAVKFTDAGEVLVSVSSAGSTNGGLSLRFAVRDTGLGIHPDQQAMIFEAFTQADSSVTRRFGGTGLGLAISQRLVTLMGGRLELASSLGRGSEFHFTLEMEPARKSDGTHAARTPTLLAGKRVLVVDDNQSAREIFREMIGRFHMQVDTAASGDEAIERLRAKGGVSQYDIILMDWHMPGLDGVQTLQNLRGDLALAKSPVVVMVTAYEVDELRAQLNEASVRGFLTKPVSASRMLDALSAALGERRAEGAEAPAEPVRAPAADRFRGARVMVVEDNEINQTVARELLEGVGCDVRIAGNGAEALRMLQDGSAPRPDIVFLDLQMPVMDGFETTRRLREMPEFRDLPVIALTARALADDRGRCLRAGMSDYLDKPIDPDALYATVGRWLRRNVGPVPELAAGATAESSGGRRSDDRSPRSLPGADAAAVASTAGSGANPGGCSTLDAAAGLARLRGNEAKYRGLLERYAIDYAGVADSIERAWKQEGAAAARKIVHDAIGVSGTLGLSGVHAAAVETQAALKATTEASLTDSTEVEFAIAKLRAELALGLESIGRFVAAEEAPAAVSDSPVAAPPLALLEHLSLLIAEGNLAASDMAALLARACRETPHAAAASELEECLRSYDFDRAAGIAGGLQAALEKADSGGTDA